MLTGPPPHHSHGFFLVMAFSDLMGDSGPCPHAQPSRADGPFSHWPSSGHRTWPPHYSEDCWLVVSSCRQDSSPSSIPSSPGSPHHSWLPSIPYTPGPSGLILVCQVPDWPSWPMFPLNPHDRGHYSPLLTEGRMSDLAESHPGFGPGRRAQSGPLPAPSTRTSARCPPTPSSCHILSLHCLANSCKRHLLRGGLLCLLGGPPASSQGTHVSCGLHPPQVLGLRAPPPPQVFRELESAVLSCLGGYSVCIFTYGQTGTGKTYSMEVGEAGVRAAPGARGWDVSPTRLPTPSPGPT